MWWQRWWWTHQRLWIRYCDSIQEWWCRYSSLALLKKAWHWRSMKWQKLRLWEKEGWNSMLLLEQKLLLGLLLLGVINPLLLLRVVLLLLKQPLFLLKWTYEAFVDFLFPSRHEESISAHDWSIYYWHLRVHLGVLQGCFNICYLFLAIC